MEWWSNGVLVSCPANNMAFVAIKMGAGPAAAGREEGAYLSRYVTDPAAAGQPPAHFHRNPPGRGQLAVFLRCSLLTYQFRYARRSRLEKQPTDRRRKPCYLWDRTLAGHASVGGRDFDLYAEVFT